MILLHSKFLEKLLGFYSLLKRIKAEHLLKEELLFLRRFSSF
ncbi:hypothetical protein EV13_2604 [Prochlorococcus sp. MIT 0702]|nr:hypothetical protein EV13_2604 [Prochlorococcus sp. MIT 0702]KGG31109.1 hypothetical protein EV14_2479 [Prochlorococcus sp. MIT 0703]